MIFRQNFNGIRIIHEKRHQPNILGLGVLVGTGSRFENKNLNGISHFIEHLVFKGTQNYPSAYDINFASALYGCELNAFTCEEYTFFGLKTTTRNFSKAFDLLFELIFKPLLKKEDIELEREVIFSEQAMYEDTPSSLIVDLSIAEVFKSSSLGFPVLGTKESIAAISRKALKSYMQRYYNIHNMIFTFSGNINTDKIQNIIFPYLSNVHSKSKYSWKNLMTNFTPAPLFLNKTPRIFYRDVNQAQISIIYPAVSYNHPDSLKYRLLNLIIGSASFSKLNSEIREKRGLAYDVGSELKEWFDTGILRIYIASAPELVDYIVELVEKEIKNLPESLNSKELEAAKKYYINHTYLRMEDAIEICILNAESEYLTTRIIETKEELKIIKKISLKDLKSLASNLKVVKPGIIIIKSE